MVSQYWSYVDIVERLKVNDIVFCLSVFEIRWYEGLWAYVYKGVELKMVNENAKSFVCVREMKVLNIEPNETNSSLKTLNKKCNKK